MDNRPLKNAPRLRGHSAHPPLTDFPIALLAISLVWDIVALASGNDIWWQFAFWSQVAGLIAVVPTALTGFIEYIVLPDGHPASGTATRHMLVMISATLPYIGSVAVRGGTEAPEGSILVLAVVLNVVGLALLLVGGWLGGELVSRHGLGTTAETNTVPSEANPEDVVPRSNQHAPGNAMPRGSKQ
ncbi:MAG TPA: DUF2231 domain-containing protein [Nitrolancea sp.]